jgi:hypothetical protein
VRIAIASTSLCLVASCSFFVDTSELSGRTAQTATAADDGGAEKRSDTGTSTLPAPDATVAAADGDAAATGDAGSRGPCAVAVANRIFCDDFDTGPTDLSLRWASYTAASGPGQLDLLDAVSAPRSLRFAIRADAGDATSELYQRVLGLSNAVQLDFDLKASGGVLPADAIMAVAKLELFPAPTGATFHQVSVGINAGGSVIDYYRLDPTSNMTQSAPTLGASWRHITVKVSFRSLPATATFSIDGTPVASVTLAGDTLTSVGIGIGVHYAKNIGSIWSLGYDNVEVRKL